MSGFFSRMFKGEPITLVDPNTVIEKGDKIGFCYADCYSEGIIESVLDQNIPEGRSPKYLIRFTRHDAPKWYNFTWVGEALLVELKYTPWTMIQKHIDVKGL